MIIFTCGNVVFSIYPLRFPVIFKSVTIFDVSILKNPWAIEFKMEMLL